MTFAFAIWMGESLFNKVFLTQCHESLRKSCLYAEAVFILSPIHRQAFLSARNRGMNLLNFTFSHDCFSIDSSASFRPWHCKNSCKTTRYMFLQMMSSKSNDLPLTIINFDFRILKLTYLTISSVSYLPTTYRRIAFKSTWN